MTNMLWWIAAACAALGVGALLLALSAWRQRRFFRGTWRLLWSLVFVCAGLVFAGLEVGIRGYHALTHEELAVVVRTEPIEPNRFQARFYFPDGRSQSYLLNGDQLYVDARILKWHPLANFFGLRTAYELDRVSGRYADLTAEQQRPRTVFSLSPDRPVDVFDLRRRYTFLSPIVDADYGSATFIAADVPARYEVRVSITGLLVRRVEMPGGGGG